ncbi:MAG: hypothetical protein MIO92_06295 [Methanosarcinaceae archaeon]|nr:hypothetical protein [Methanosarcinaceae archaeon]
MPDLFDNAARFDGFELIEFSAPEKGHLEMVFETIEFAQVARHAAWGEQRIAVDSGGANTPSS